MRCRNAAASAAQPLYGIANAPIEVRGGGDDDVIEATGEGPKAIKLVSNALRGAATTCCAPSTRGCQLASAAAAADICFNRPPAYAN
jgi:hypothetical protein